MSKYKQAWQAGIAIALLCLGGCSSTGGEEEYVPTGPIIATSSSSSLDRPLSGSPDASDPLLAGETGTTSEDCRRLSGGGPGVADTTTPAGDLSSGTSNIPGNDEEQCVSGRANF